MISPEVNRYIGEFTAYAVALWREKGQNDDELIRIRGTKIAAEAVTKLSNMWDQETYVAEFQRGFERALKRRPKH